MQRVDKLCPVVLDFYFTTFQVRPVVAWVPTDREDVCSVSRQPEFTPLPRGACSEAGEGDPQDCGEDLSA